VLGVACGGATYHSSKSARDRDRLRQDVLEGLNWKIHWVWSTIGAAVVRCRALLVPNTFPCVHHHDRSRACDEPRPGAVGVSHEAVRNVGNDLVIAVFVHGHDPARLQGCVVEAGKRTIAVIAMLPDSVTRQIGDDGEGTVLVAVLAARLFVEHGVGPWMLQ
jgi:hypothetical protein